MDTATRQGLEAVLFLAEEPVAAGDLAEVLGLDAADVETELEALAEQYAAQERGIEIRRAAGGWRMYTAAGARPVLERWALAGRSGRLTQAALETLAVIAYKQPISRQEIGDIRGVNADGAVRSLVARGLVEEVGRDEGPGQALLYGTTTLFLERIGIDDLAELPPLTDFLPEAPAPDEPELGAIREARRRIAEASAAGGEPGSGPARGDVDEEDDSLPPPTPHVARGGDIDELTDRLDQAARSAVDRLRQAVSATERDAEHAEDAADGTAARDADAAEDAADGTGSRDADDADGPWAGNGARDQARDEGRAERSSDG